ncbi:MAG: MarR family winged helix-turn-helix transcriptional regulator [Paracoccaceae bacterium]
MENARHDSAGAWAKKFHLASRAAVDKILRPYDLGSTQWYVLWHLAHDGPKAQRDLLRILQVEKPTLSGVVSALVRKGIVDQLPDPEDQRQRVLTLTPAGARLWQSLPDPVALILDEAFEGASEQDLATVVRVLRTATERLQSQMTKGEKS